MSHRIESGKRDGFETRILVSPEDIEAEFTPGAGMVGCSLRHWGAELLGQRRGLAHYARHGGTMGIPLLHPWANRLARRGYTWKGVIVDIPPGAPCVDDDENGLPIHGLLAGCSAWEVTLQQADKAAARLSARCNVASLPDVMASFPFPHRLFLDIQLAGDELTIATTLEATGVRPVPIAFGYHPYLRLPGVPRRDWSVEMPVVKRAILDERCLPTGQTEAAAFAFGPLGDRVLDDLFPQIKPDAVFALEGGGRRIEVAYGDAYPVAVVYAPADDDVVCFEPMTVPTNPFEGGWDVVSVPPGERFSASFSIRVLST